MFKCVNAISSGKDWQKPITRSLELDDGYMDWDEMDAIADIREIVEDSARLEAVKKFFDISLLEKVASAKD